MTWRNLTSVFSAALRRVACISNLALGRSGQTGGRSGAAQPAFRSQRSDGALLSRRDYIAGKIRKARRQHRPRKGLYSEARAITHGILANGRG